MLAVPSVRGLFVIITPSLGSFLSRFFATVRRPQLPVTAIALSIPVLLLLVTSVALCCFRPRFFQPFLLVSDFIFKVLLCFFHLLVLFFVSGLGLVETLLKLLLFSLLKFGHDRPLEAAPCKVFLLLLRENGWLAGFNVTRFLDDVAAGARQSTVRLFGLDVLQVVVLKSLVAD